MTWETNKHTSRSQQKSANAPAAQIPESPRVFTLGQKESETFAFSLDLSFQKLYSVDFPTIRQPIPASTAVVGLGERRIVLILPDGQQLQQQNSSPWLPVLACAVSPQGSYSPLRLFNTLC